MKKGKLIGRILGIALVGVMIGAMPGVLASIGSASEEVITVEDTDPGFSKYGTASYWWEDWVGGDHMYYTYNGYNTVDNYAKWTPSLPSAGIYPVYVWIPANHATTTNAIYTIHHNGQDDTRYVRQSDHSYWILLGYFYFSASGNEYVKLVDMTYESSASKQVGFDAVRWVKREFDLPQYVNGIDVSHWQGTINWVQVYNEGFRFAFAKATQGTGILDGNFMTNMNNGRNAGMFMGAYHYATPDSSTAADQANYFVDQAGEYITAGYLRPALDLEETGGLGQAVLSQWVNNFMSTVKSRTGVEPILYTSPSFANDNLDVTVVNEYDLWIAHWRTDLNPSTGGWDHWDFWQHTIGAKGSVPGINAEIDWDRFNGDISKLQQDFVIGQPPVYPKPTISASEYQTEIDVGETDWVKFTLRNDGTEYTDWWGIQVRVGDGLELVEHSSYPWSQGNMCNGKAAEWYKENDLGVGASDYIIVGIKGKTVSNYESVWYTAWMHDPDEQPEWIQYSHPVRSVPCDRDYAEYGVEVTPADYDEYFWSVTPYTYDSDSDGFNDSVTLEMDVDTTGDYVDVTVIGDLYDLNGTWVDEDSATWNIYGAAIEYGYLDLTNYGSIAGDCTYYLDLYDENGNYEDDWVGSVYLYPVGYVAQPPEVTTHPATDVTSTSATLHGYLDSLGDYNRVACTPEPPEFSLTKDYCVPTEATISVEAAIGDRYVEYWEHVTDGGICVKNDYVLIHRDIDSNEIINYEKNWREVEFTSGPIAPFEPPGGEYFWKRAVAFLDSGDCGYFYTMSELQEYPLVCWEVRYTDGTTTMYDLDGNEIGCGIPAPSKGFSLSGYYDSSLPDGWINWRLNADEWFQEWNLSTASLPLPTPTIISSYVSDPDYQFYYALAHGGSWYFQADNEGSYYYGSDAADDMENRPPMIFAFLGHCEGMTDIEPGTFSYEFRKGSMVDTVTVGYSGMSDCPGWSDSLEWQDYMFQKMDEGYTMRDAFDLASAQYPLIADCVVFVGDPDLTVPPIYVSFEWWTDPAHKNETFCRPMYATGPFNEGLTGLIPGTTYYFQAKAVADGVTVYGDVLSFLTRPDAPISFSASTVSSNQIDLSWTKGAGAQKTKIQKKQGSYPTNRNDGTQVYFDTGTAISDAGLAPDTTYYYRAWSYVQAGEEQWSDNCAEDFSTTMSGVTIPVVTTSAATLVEETTATLNGAVSDDGGEACQYRFGYSTTPGGPYTHTTWSVDTKTTGQSFSQALLSLNKGTKYYFIAQAKNSAGTGSGSELSFLTKPDAPISFSASTVSSTQIDLSWTKGAGAQKTKIQRKQGSYPANKDDGTQVYFDTGTAKSDTELAPGTTYYYRAWSYVSGSEEKWSDNCAEDFATTASGTTPPTVSNNGGATDITSNSARLNGEVTSTGGENPTVYIYWGDNDGGTTPASWEHQENLGTKGAGTFSTDVSGLAPETKYYYRCYATNLAGNDWADNTESFDTVAASEVNISLQPATEHVGVGEVFDLIIQAEAGDQPVSGISAFIDFDPAYLEVVDADAETGGIQITPGSTLTMVMLNEADNSIGTIDYSAGKLGEPFPTGTFTVATIQFRALAQTSPITSIIFSTDFPRETVVDYSGNDVTGTLTGGTVCISEATVDISVVLQGGSRPPEGWEVPITIKFFSPGADVMTDSPVAQFDLTTTKSGSTATCQCTVAPGTYDVTVVSEHTLINVKRDVVISTPSTAVDMGTLLEGNANDDNIINISDFGILAVSFMCTEGEPGYDPRADFDRNGIINISDFGLLAVNYMKMSPFDVSG